jgi:hypothetical protein
MKRFIELRKKLESLIKDVTGTYFQEIEKADLTLPTPVRGLIERWVGVELLRASLTDTEFNLFKWKTSLALPLLTMPDVFLSALKKDPFLIERPAFQEWIRILRSLCITGTATDVKFARNFLEKAGLPLFIPSTSKRITHDPFVRSCQQNPSFLGWLVEQCKTEIKPFYHPPYTRSRQKKLSDLNKAFQHIFGTPLPKGLLFGERDKDLTSIALAFVAYAYGSDWERLRQIYYSTKRKPRENVSPFEG